MAYAGVADVQELLGRELTAEETAMVERRLSQAERLILRRIPDLADQIEAEEIDPADVVDVEAEAVLRVIRNAEGIISESDGSYSYMRTAEAADNTLRITAEEWDLLGVRARGLFQLTPNLSMVKRAGFGSGG